AGPQKAFATAICGGEEERGIAQLAVGFAQMPQNVETRHVRPFHITQDETRAGAGFLYAFRPLARRQRAQALPPQDPGQEFARFGIVLDAEDLWAAGHVTANADVCGSSMVTLVPRSTSLSINRRPRWASMIRSTT